MASVFMGWPNAAGMLKVECTVLAKELRFFAAVPETPVMRIFLFCSANLMINLLVRNDFLEPGPSASSTKPLLLFTILSKAELSLNSPFR